MNVNISKNSIVYVVCPAGIKTGGTELAHQLVELLNRYGVKSFICYITNEHDVKICDDFQEYIQCYKTLNELEDNENNLVIIPEAWTFLAKKYSKIQKSIWWMSVDNYAKNASVLFALKKYGYEQAIKTIIKKITRSKAQLSIKTLKTFNYHFVQSEYAKEYLRSQGIESIDLSDYINPIYYGLDRTKMKKENIVAYNPKKGAKITKRVIEAYNDQVQWVPLINMTNVQMSEILQKTKVYIDFGPFPGKDRIPREAALSYCCVVTGTCGASGFERDMPINNKYKFSSPLKEIKQIVNTINDCILNYDIRIDEFSSYRKQILTEKEEFEKQVKKVFTLEE